MLVVCKLAQVSHVGVVAKPADTRGQCVTDTSIGWHILSWNCKTYSYFAYLPTYILTCDRYSPIFHLTALGIHRYLRLPRMVVCITGFILTARI